MEREPDIAELLDLRVLDDRLVYAGLDGGERRLRRSRLRVATRYPRIAREYFARSGRQVQTLEKKLNEASSFLNGWRNGKNPVGTV